MKARHFYSNEKRGIRVDVANSSSWEAPAIACYPVPHVLDNLVTAGYIVFGSPIINASLSALKDKRTREVCGSCKAYTAVSS